jgi:copper chaperone CopZ
MGIYWFVNLKGDFDDAQVQGGDMSTVYLNIQGISSPECIGVIKDALKSIGDIGSIHVDWESGRAQITRSLNRSDDLIHLINKEGYQASLDLDEV